MSEEKTSDPFLIEGASIPSYYEEFVERILGSTVTRESVKETVQPTQLNAEDEVVAILISAMMGSIVKSVEIKPRPEKTSEMLDSIDYNELNQGEETESESFRSAKDATESGVLSYLSVQKSIFSGYSRNKTQTLSKHPSEAPVPEDGDSSLNKLSEIDNTIIPNDTASFELEGSKDISFLSIVEEETNPLQQLKGLLSHNQDKVSGWEFLESGLDVVITFKRGNRYEGKLLNCRMHGKGRFLWADGSVYEGDFFHGEMTGQGKLQWPGVSWYEGEICQGFRHGLGLYVEVPSFYAGYWKCGRRHGLGAMFYDHSNTKKNYYNGEWSNDCKHGTGLRSYPSGAMYSGQWWAGRRHGLGTMVWTNNDVYSGNWDHGKMHGYGEYTWDTFCNRQLVVPEENCYYGNWEKNVRHGNGTLESSSGVIVRGTWKKGKKHGPAEVICSNGSFLYSDNLFIEDCLSLVPENSVEADSLMNASVQSLYRLPVSAASHNINLGYYIYRLLDYTNECHTMGKPFGKTSSENEVNTNRTFSFSRRFPQGDNQFQFDKEETLLRNILMQFLSTLKFIYTFYSQLGCDVKPNFSTILMRLMWWQLIRDCNLHVRGWSLADFDILIANNKACLVQGVHYPYERLHFWQFLHCIIEISWELYGKTCTGTPSVEGVLASALHKLITSDLVPNAGRHKGNVLFGCRNLISLDSLYWYYRGVGEPHSARTFLTNAVLPQEDDGGQESVREYPEHIIRGKNIIGVGGKLTYFPEPEPLIAGEKHSHDPNHPRNLSCLGSIGLLAVLDCILEICPSISTGGLIVNMDYKLVFLEFYEVLLLCARLKAKKNILERKQKEEEEYLKMFPTEETDMETESTQQVEEIPPSPEKSSKPKKGSTSKKSKKKK